MASTHGKKCRVSESHRTKLSSGVNPFRLMDESKLIHLCREVLVEDRKARGVAINGTCIVRGLVAFPVSPSCGFWVAMTEFYSVKL